MVAQGAARQPDRVGHGAQVATHQGQVAGLDGGVGARCPWPGRGRPGPARRRRSPRRRPSPRRGPAPWSRCDHGRPSPRAARRRSPRRCPPRPRPCGPRAALSPVSSTGRSPRSRSRATPSARAVLDGVGHRRARPRSDRPSRRGSRCSPRASARSRRGHEVGREVQAPVGAASARARPPPRDRRRRPATPSPRVDANDSTAGSVAVPSSSRAPSAMARGDRVLGRVLEGARRAAAPHRRSVPAAGDHVDQLHAAGGERAGLVEHDRVDARASTRAPRGP